jgi:hypothetical protein
MPGGGRNTHTHTHAHARTHARTRARTHAPFTKAFAFHILKSGTLPFESLVFNHSHPHSPVAFAILLKSGFLTLLTAMAPASTKYLR